MHSPYEIGFLSEQNGKRVARHVKEYRAPRKQNEQVVGSGLVLKTRLSIATALALFFGG